MFPGKPGYVNQCVDCADDVPLLGGNMIWSHKTAPEIEIKSMAAAKVFASKTRRFGAGVTCCLTQSKATGPDNNGGNPVNGLASAGQQYISRLGEKRVVKR